MLASYPEDLGRIVPIVSRRDEGRTPIPAVRTRTKNCLAVAKIGDPQVMFGRVGKRQDDGTPLQTPRGGRHVLRSRGTILKQIPDLRGGHALQTSRAAGKHAHKVGGDGVVESGDAVGEKPGDGGGESVSSERTEERLERLPDHERERSRRVFHGGVPRMSWHINTTPLRSVFGPL